MVAGDTERYPPLKGYLIPSYKIDELGVGVKVKARLVVDGRTQVENFDHEKIFAPTPAVPAITIAVAVTVHNDFPSYRLNVTQAFVHGELDHILSNSLPPGCADNSGKAGKLNRALYGLKQTGRQWNFRLVDELVACGMEQRQMDPFVCRKMADDKVE